MGDLGGEGPAKVVIDTRNDPTGVPLVILSGELDSSNIASLQAAIDSITGRRPKGLIFDLSGLRFMDSAGIAVLIDAAAKVEAVHLRDPSPVVRRVIELTGLSTLLPMQP
jgi:anti-anti-sigma factor